MLDQLEGHLGTAGDLLGELPRGLLDEGSEGVVQGAVVHAAVVRPSRAASSRAHARLHIDRTENRQAATADSAVTGCSTQAPSSLSHSRP